jgi:glutathione synthase/RimK-type ligase-like ATP-grasp enzyme
MELVIPSYPFSEWEKLFLKTKKCKNLNKNLPINYKIMPICIDDYKKYNDDPKCIFKNNIDYIEILDNKSKFGKYMLNNFPENTPPTIYYNFDDETFYDEKLVSTNMIIKPNKGHASIGIKRINTINITEIHNHIVQTFIENTIYYSSHFLVMNGVILNKIFFYSDYKYPNNIKVGKIKFYQITEKLDIDDSIFDKIFCNLNYSGFACPEFIIHNNKIIIFEINSRPGGSLVSNDLYLNLFLDTLNKNYSK